MAHKKLTGRIPTEAVSMPVHFQNKAAARAEKRRRPQTKWTPSVAVKTCLFQKGNIAAVEWVNNIYLQARVQLMLLIHTILQKKKLDKCSAARAFLQLQLNTYLCKNCNNICSYPSRQLLEKIVASAHPLQHHYHQKLKGTLTLHLPKVKSGPFKANVNLSLQRGGDDSHPYPG